MVHNYCSGFKFCMTKAPQTAELFYCKKKNVNETKFKIEEAIQKKFCPVSFHFIKTDPQSTTRREKKRLSFRLLSAINADQHERRPKESKTKIKTFEN